MRLRKVLLATLFALAACPLSAEGQGNEPDSARYGGFKFDGVLKNKFEYVHSTGNYRFSVRNSRLGVAGKIAPQADYRAQVELSSEGKFQVLDLSGTLTVARGLSFTFGQTGIPIFNAYTTNPGTMMFANRTFLAKYYAGTRDIGLLAQYAFDGLAFPVGVEFGVFNGNVINDPVWGDRFSYSARLTFGQMKGFRSTLKIYDYPKDDNESYFLYGADLRYAAGNWTVETEIMKRDSRPRRVNLTAGYVEGAYSFPVAWKLFRNIVPAVRWDAIDQTSDGKIDVQRITAGLGFGLTKKAFSSLLRLDYEWYFVNNELDFLRVNDEMDANKFTIELVYVF